ncbi:type II toxin-antitoxin system VapC family toxin [Nocardia sp. NPDC058497]|uniref:type II toxin-antitoxin system VapC family toxin n=1 Tax=Nocardia sp. NPDC058497 TaxID=3346529 RepID=UPI0036693909
MVIDTSAVVTILTNEPEAACYEDAIAADPVRLMSTGTYLELSIVIEARYGEPGGRELDLWLHRAAVDLIAVHPEHAHRARTAYRNFGKGRHPAGLNFGDCFSYALSKVSGEPLLFKGNDFTRTDVTQVELAGSEP